MKCDFTTTTEDISYVSSLSIMCCFKKYFKYKEILYGCGIPSITLTGTVKDWEKILEKIKLIKDYDMAWVEQSIVPIIQEFINAKKGQINLKFWENMIKKRTVKEKIYGLSGRYIGTEKKDYINGWICSFFPYSNEGDFAIRKEIEVNEIDSLASQILKIPYVIKEKKGKEIKMNFYAGFLGMKQDKKTRKLTPLIGWYTKEAEEKDKREEAI